jgi:hypothetical protein
VGANGPVGDEELLADLAVRKSFGGQPGDLELLGSQLVAGLGDTPTARLAGSFPDEDLQPQPKVKT